MFQISNRLIHVALAAALALHARFEPCPEFSPPPHTLHPDEYIRSHTDGYDQYASIYPNVLKLVVINKFGLRTTFLQVQIPFLETNALHHKQVQYMHDIHVTLVMKCVFDRVIPIRTEERLLRISTCSKDYLQICEPSFQQQIICKSS